MQNHATPDTFWGRRAGHLRLPQPPASPRIAALDEAVHSLASLAARPQFHTLALQQAGLVKGVLPRHPAWAIDPALYGVLLALSISLGAGPSDLAAVLAIHPTTVSHHLARLEERRLIERRPPFTGTHPYQILFTEPGILGFETVRDARHVLLARLITRHSDDVGETVETLRELERGVRWLIADARRFSGRRL